MAFKRFSPMVVTLDQQYNVGEKLTVILYTYYSNWLLFKEKSERISRSSEHPPVKEKKCSRKNQNAPRPSFVDSHIQRIVTCN